MTWIGNGSARTAIAKSISATTMRRCYRTRRATTPTPAGASGIRETTIGYARIDRRTTTSNAGRRRPQPAVSRPANVAGRERSKPAAQADEPAAALLPLDALVDDDDEGAAAELPFDDAPELPLLDEALSDPLAPAVDVVPDVDDVSLVDDSLAGDGADPLALSARESVR